MTVYQQNWAGNYTFNAARVHWPESIEQVQEIVSRSRQVKVFGARHSFNGIADSAEDHISLERLEQTVLLDAGRRTVTVSGGITYGQLCSHLHNQGYALHNMASLPHITVAGACATATHGSGDNNGNLATAVAALELITAGGDRIVLSREQHGDLFQGAVVALGGLGVVANITLDLAPAFSMQQEVYENLPVAQLESSFEAIMSCAYSVSLFVDWQTDHVNQVWVKRRLTGEGALVAEPTFFEATLAARHLHPVTYLSADPCTLQMSIAGPWHERLPHFRVDHTPASGDELQTEYFVPRQHAVAAIHAIMELREQMAPLLWTSEVRSIAADTLWMSPNYQQPSIGIHFSWKRDWPAVQKLLAQLEARLAPFQARPHWGKLFTLSPAYVQSLYPRLEEFRQLLRTYDPEGKFCNTYLERYIFGVDGCSA
jgi:alditol oxidase